MDDSKDAIRSPLMMDGRYYQSAQAKYNIKLAVVALKQGLALNADVSSALRALKSHLEHYILLAKPDAFQDINHTTPNDDAGLFQPQPLSGGLDEKNHGVVADESMDLVTLTTAVEHWLTDEKSFDKHINDALNILLKLDLKLEGRVSSCRPPLTPSVSGDWVDDFCHEPSLKKLLDVMYETPNLSQGFGALHSLSRHEQTALREALHHECMVKLMHQLHGLCYSKEVALSLGEDLGTEERQSLTVLYHCVIDFFDAVEELMYLAGDDKRPCPYIRTPFLPAPIKIACDTLYLQALVGEIKARPLSPVSVSKDPAHALLDRLYEAYQFRFNPLVLVQLLVDALEDDKAFGALLAQASTQTCIDLHAFLAGKDTQYLLRCLHALKEGVPLSNIEIQKANPPECINLVYEKLLAWKCQLKEALSSRHIHIEFEVIDYQENKMLSPGERITQALNWLINHSEREPLKERHNERLENLFSLLSSYHQTGKSL